MEQLPERSDAAALPPRRRHKKRRQPAPHLERRTLRLPNLPRPRPTTIPLPILRPPQPNPHPPPPRLFRYLDQIDAPPWAYLSNPLWSIVSPASSSSRARIFFQAPGSSIET